MCLICVEYYYQRMTREEVKNALPEMVMFAKTEEERNHFKKLQTLDSDSEFEKVAKEHIDTSENKNEHKTFSKIKTRRS